MSKGLDRLHGSDFNTMQQEWQGNGTVLITLKKRGEGKVYRLVVRNPYGPDEELISEEEVEVE